MSEFLHANSWLLTYVVIALAIIAALVAVRRIARRANANAIPAAAPYTLEDLEERVSHYVQQLRDLERHQHKLESDAYATERALFETKAADALREKAALKQQTSSAPPVAIKQRPDKPNDVSPFARFMQDRPKLQGALWGGGVVAVAMGLFALVESEQKPRDVGGPMAQPSDTTPGQATSTVIDDEFVELKRRLTESPNDTDALAQLAHKLLRLMMLDEAKQINERLLQVSPDHPEGLVHLAVLRASNGESEQAIADLSSLLAKHPTLAEGWMFRGMIAMQSGKTDVMRESFERYVAVAPPSPQRDRIEAMLKQSTGASP